MAQATPFSMPSINQVALSGTLVDGPHQRVGFEDGYKKGAWVGVLSVVRPYRKTRSDKWEREEVRVSVCFEDKPEWKEGPPFEQGEALFVAGRLITHGDTSGGTNQLEVRVRQFQRLSQEDQDE